MRWVILGVLFFARMTMGFQFQSVAALAPDLTSAYGVSMAGIGAMIGLYLLPGIVVSIPGGAIAAWFGDRRVVGGAMVLMLAGGGLAALAPSWELALTARIVAGVGGVVVNVVLTKMLVDWFTGHEISTAMAIFINSWPVGIALALLVLPPVAEAGGLALADGVTLAVIAAGLALFLALYRPAPGAVTGAGVSVVSLPVVPLFLAGLVWAFYNAAFAAIFGFGPVALAALGWEAAPASALTSAFVVALSLSLPFGGALADRTGRGDLVIASSLTSFAVLCLAVPFAEGAVLVCALLLSGVLLGLGAGPIMALPAQVLAPAARAFGMGVFFAIYYAVMPAAAAVAGYLVAARGDGTVILLWAAALALAAFAALAMLRLRALQRPV